jgi:hypothetical protein
MYLSGLDQLRRGLPVEVRAGSSMKKIVAWLGVGAMAVAVALVAPGTAQAAPVAVSADKMWQTDARVDAALYSADGKTLYVAGVFTHLCPAGQPVCNGTGGSDLAISYLAELDATTGNAITTWHPQPDGEVEALALGPNGTLYVGGVFNHIGTQVHHKVAVLSAATGAPVASWNPNVSAQVKTLALSPDASTVYLGGDFATVSGATRHELAALSTYTSTKTTPTVLPWDPEPTGTTTVDKGVLIPSTVNSLTVRPSDGQVYAGGVFTTIGGLPRNNVAALAPATATSIGAGVAGFIMNPLLNYVVLDVTTTRDGSTVFVNGRGPGGFVRGVDSTSGQQLWARHFDGDVQAAVATDTLVYVGGHFDNINVPGTSLLDVRHHAAALDTSTGATDPWNPTANSAFGVYGMAWSPGHVAAAGDFTKIQNLAHAGIAQFSGTDAIAPAAVTDVVATSTAKGRVDLTWSASVDGDTTTLGYRIYRRTVGGTYALLVNVPGPNAATATGPLTYSDITGHIGMAYQYAIRVADPVFLSGWSNDAGPVTVLGDQFPPGVPTGVTASSPSPGNVDVAWNGGGDGDDTTVTYTVSHTSGTTTTDVGTVVGAASGPQAFHDTGTAGGTFTYAVRASDGTFTSARSTASAAVVMKADPGKPSVPGGVAVTSSTVNAVVVSWHASTDAEQSAAQLGYLVSRKLKTASGSGTVIATTAPGATSFTDTSDSLTPALPGKAYTYYVAANDGPNTSAKTAGVSVTVASSIFVDPMASLSAWTLPVTASGVSLDTVHGHSAAPSARLVGSVTPASSGYASRALGGSFRTVCVQEWVSFTAYDTSSANAQTSLLRVFSSAGNDIARLYVDNKGLLWIRSDWGSSPNITTVTIPANGTWHSAELCVTTTPAATTGTMWALWDGKNLGTITGVDNSADALASIDIGERNPATFSFEVDDVSVGTSQR